MRPSRLILALPLLATLAVAVEPAAGQRLVTVFPSEDTSPYDFIPTLNRGSYPSLYAQTAFDAGGVNHSMSKYLKFDLSGLLQPGETVFSAELRVEYAFSFSHEGDPPNLIGVMQAHDVLAPWSQSSVVAANKPPISGAFATEGGITDFKTLFFDVTDRVKQWAVGGQNNGVALTSAGVRPLGSWSIERHLVEPLPTSIRNRLVVLVAPGFIDDDFDGIEDLVDNCLGVSNPAQADDDDDGHGNLCDNCVAIANEDQSDIDAGSDDDLNAPGMQSFGDVCDADLDNDGAVGPSDFFGMLRPCLGQSASSAGCAAADLDGDGVVGPSDFFAFLRPELGGTPGPGMTLP